MQKKKKSQLKCFYLDRDFQNDIMAGTIHLLKWQSFANIELVTNIQHPLEKKTACVYVNIFVSKYKYTSQ